MDSRYKQEVAKYGNKDGVIALCLFLFYCLWSVGFALIVRAFDDSLTGLQLQIVGIFLSLLLIAVVVVMIFIKKQGFSSIGLHREKLGSATRLGIMFALIPLIIAGLLPGIMYGWELVSIGMMIYFLFYSLVLAGAEDIVFVGFIQTRLYGLFKSDKAAIGIGAALFSLGHVPAWLLMGNLDLDNLLFFAIFVVFWAAMHWVSVSLFRRYFSLVPVIILHTISNFSQTALWVLTDENREYAESWAMTAMIAIIVAVCVWNWYTDRRKKVTN
jgi:membrane protease YdiL (CAAX protease family)